MSSVLRHSLEMGLYLGLAPMALIIGLIISGQGWRSDPFTQADFATSADGPENEEVAYMVARK